MPSIRTDKNLLLQTILYNVMGFSEYAPLCCQCFWARGLQFSFLHLQKMRPFDSVFLTRHCCTQQLWPLLRKSSYTEIDSRRIFQPILTLDVLEKANGQWQRAFTKGREKKKALWLQPQNIWRLYRSWKQWFIKTIKDTECSKHGPVRAYHSGSFPSTHSHEKERKTKTTWAPPPPYVQKGTKK